MSRLLRESKTSGLSELAKSLIRSKQNKIIDTNKISSFIQGTINSTMRTSSSNVASPASSTAINLCEDSEVTPNVVMLSNNDNIGFDVKDRLIKSKMEDLEVYIDPNEFLNGNCGIIFSRGKPARKANHVAVVFNENEEADALRLIKQKNLASKLMLIACKSSESLAYAKENNVLLNQVPGLLKETEIIVQAICKLLAIQKMVNIRPSDIKDHFLLKMKEVIHNFPKLK